MCELSQEEGHNPPWSWIIPNLSTHTGSGSSHWPESSPNLRTFALVKLTLCHLDRHGRWEPPPCGCRWTVLQSLWLLLKPNLPWWIQTPPEKRQKGRKETGEGKGMIKKWKQWQVREWSTETEKHLSFTSSFFRLSDSPLPAEYILQLHYCGDSFWCLCLHIHTSPFATTTAKDSLLLLSPQTISRFLLK